MEFLGRRPGLCRWRNQMLTKCANPVCLTHFRYLERGTLFRYENDPRAAPDRAHREYFWLCGSCSSSLTMRLDAQGKVFVTEDEAEERPPGNGGPDFVLAGRQNGMLLSRIRFFQTRSRRHDINERGQVHA